MRLPLLALLSAVLVACTSLPPMPPLVSRDGAPLDVLLLGEQHDAALHQDMHRRVIQALAQRGTLGAVVIEMAERGHSTAGLPRDATEAQVREALGWEQSGWPWDAYRPAIMTAVAAGVPVIGGNLPRSQMREAMNDARFDTMLPGPALKAQQQAVRRGHCDLLPERQIKPMTRIQIARDESMARTLEAAAVPGKTVVLLAGGRHVDEQVGVPLHMKAGLRLEATEWPGQPAKKDYCAELQARMRAHGTMGQMP